MRGALRDKMIAAAKASRPKKPKRTGRKVDIARGVIPWNGKQPAAFPLGAQPVPFPEPLKQQGPMTPRRPLPRDRRGRVPRYSAEGMARAKKPHAGALRGRHGAGEEAARGRAARWTEAKVRAPGHVTILRYHIRRANNRLVYWWVCLLAALEELAILVGLLPRHRPPSRLGVFIRGRSARHAARRIATDPRFVPGGSVHPGPRERES